MLAGDIYGTTTIGTALRALNALYSASSVVCLLCSLAAIRRQRQWIADMELPVGAQ